MNVIHIDHDHSQLIILQEKKSVQVFYRNLLLMIGY